MRTCPGCGQEYEEWVEVCSDCRPPIQLGAESPPSPDPLPTPAAEEAGSSQGAPEGTRAIRSFDTREVGEIGQILTEEGIKAQASLVSRDGDSVFGSTAAVLERYFLHVPIDRFEETIGIMKEYFGLEGDTTLSTAEESCPACGTQVSEGMSECPECELRLAQEVIAIPEHHPFLAFLSELEGD